MNWANDFIEWAFPSVAGSGFGKGLGALDPKISVLVIPLLPRDSAMERRLTKLYYNVKWHRIYPRVQGTGESATEADICREIRVHAYPPNLKAVSLGENESGSPSMPPHRLARLWIANEMPLANRMNAVQCIPWMLRFRSLRCKNSQV